MKRIIVTGSTGFIGKNLIINLLNKKVIVYPILKKSEKNIYLSKKLKKKFNNYRPVFFKNYDFFRVRFKVFTVLHMEI